MRIESSLDDPRPKLTTTDIQSLVTDVQSRGSNYDEVVENKPKQSDMRDAVKDIYLTAGQSKRIWNELYKVLDCSDVVIQVWTDELFDSRIGPGCTWPDGYSFLSCRTALEEACST